MNAYLRGVVFGLAALVTSLAATRAAEAQDDELPLITDRPDATESASAVAPMHLQLEMGATYESVGGDHSVTVPSLLARFGVVEGVEVRLGLPSYELSVGDRVEHGASGVGLGAKFVLPIGEISSIGLLPFVEIPILPSSMREGGATAGLMLVWALDITDRVGVGVNLGAMMNGLGGEDAEVAPEYFTSLAVGFGLTDRLGMFVEGFATLRPDGNHSPAVDGGFTFLATPRLQLDLAGGWIMDDDAHGGFVGVGASLLI